MSAIDNVRERTMNRLAQAEGSAHYSVEDVRDDIAMLAFAEAAAALLKHDKTPYDPFNDAKTAEWKGKRDELYGVMKWAAVNAGLLA